MKKKRNPRGIILQHHGWIIRRTAHCYILHHQCDTKMKHAVYPGSLTQALGLLHEKLLLDKRFKEGYNGSIKSFKDALVEVNKELQELLSPKTIESINRKLEVDGEHGGRT